LKIPKEEYIVSTIDQVEELKKVIVWWLFKFL
jgi:hypothetical protein